MNLKMVKVGIAAAVALGAGSLAAKAGPLDAATLSVQPGNALVLHADYDGDRGDRQWRHRRFEENHGYDNDGRGWWWRHHRYEETHRPYWRERDAREDGRDYWWR